ncbi:unnamed protein product [Agarophyton chilense]
MAVTPETKSSPLNVDEYSPVFEIVNDIFSKATTTPITPLIEGLLDAVTASKTSNAPHTATESSDSKYESSSVSSSTTSSSSSTSSLKHRYSHHAKKAELALIVQETKADGEAKHLRSKHEIDPEREAIPTPNVIINGDDEICPVGKIVSAMDSVIVVSSADWRPNDGSNPDGRTRPKISPFGPDLKSVRALDHGSALCFEDRKLLGLVDETFGPVERPFYLIRFNSSEERESTGAAMGRTVYIVKQKSTWVRGSDVITKGYDTSNWDDEECNVPNDYSDDEEERAAKQAEKRARAKKRECDINSANVLKRRRIGAQHRGSIHQGRSSSRQGMDQSFRHRNSPSDSIRLSTGRAFAATKRDSHAENSWRSGSNGAPGIHSGNAVTYSQFFTQARQALPQTMQTHGGRTGDTHAHIGAHLAPNAQAQQFYRHLGLSQSFPTVPNSYHTMASGPPYTNARALNYDEIQRLHHSQKASSSQEHFDQVPNSYWQGRVQPHVYPQRNSVEVNQGELLYGRSMGEQYGYERPSFQMGAYGVSQYRHTEFSNYPSGNIRPTHPNPEQNLEPYQQQSSILPGAQNLHKPHR